MNIALYQTSWLYKRFFPAHTYSLFKIPKCWVFASFFYRQKQKVLSLLIRLIIQTFALECDPHRSQATGMINFDFCICVVREDLIIRNKMPILWFWFWFAVNLSGLRMAHSWIHTAHIYKVKNHHRNIQVGVHWTNNTK